MRILLQRGLQGINKVFGFSVLELILREVFIDTGLQSILSDIVLQSLDKASPFLIADAVENIHSIYSMLDLYHNRVSGRSLNVQFKSVVNEFGVHNLWVGIDVPLFRVAHKFLFALSEAHKRHKVSERFLEPEIVPPLHSHEIAKPHVCQLMQSYVSYTEPQRISCLLSRLDKEIVVGYTTCVFHSTNAEFWHEYLIILREGELDSEKLFIIPDTDLGHAMHLLSIEVRSLALACVNAHWYSFG